MSWQQQPQWTPPPPKKPHTWLKLTATLTLATAIGVSIYVLSQRLPDEALAVLAGATCGVSAAVPTTLLAIVAASRLRGSNNHAQDQQTPYVIVPPQFTPMQQITPQHQPQTHIQYGPPAERNITVLGETGGHQT